MVRKYFHNEDYFETIDSDRKAYWLGYLAADATVYHYSIRLQMHSKDKELINEFISDIEYTGPIGTKIYENAKSTSEHSIALISSKKTVDDLKKLGVVQNKSKLGFWPQIDKKYISSFILGLYDGDGSLTIEKRVKYKFMPRFKLMGNDSIIKEIVAIIEKEFNYQITIHKTTGCSFFQLGGKKAICLLEWLYKDKDFKLNRKFKKFLDSKEI